MYCDPAKLQTHSGLSYISTISDGSPKPNINLCKNYFCSSSPHPRALSFERKTWQRENQILCATFVSREGVKFGKVTSKVTLLPFCTSLPTSLPHQVRELDPALQTFKSGFLQTFKKGFLLEIHFEFPHSEFLQQHLRVKFSAIQS